MKRTLFIGLLNISTISYVFYVGFLRPVIRSIKNQPQKIKDLQKAFYLSMR
jgi:hypothetical protein